MLPLLWLALVEPLGRKPSHLFLLSGVSTMSLDGFGVEAIHLAVLFDSSDSVIALSAKIEI